MPLAIYFPINKKLPRKHPTTSSLLKNRVITSSKARLTNRSLSRNITTLNFIPFQDQNPKRRTISSALKISSRTTIRPQSCLPTRIIPMCNPTITTCWTRMPITTTPTLGITRQAISATTHSTTTNQFNNTIERSTSPWISTWICTPKLWTSIWIPRPITTCPNNNPTIILPIIF